MDESQFWKNFNLGKELDIAGSFVFNGLKRFHEMESLYYESEVFEVLYDLSVGVERLLKVAVILIEHDTVANQEEFERSLITHTHQELVRRVQAKHDLNLTAPYNEFLDLLSTFYKSHRYGRYGIQSVSASSEKEMFSRFFEKYLHIEIHDDFPLDVTPTNRRMKKFLGDRVGKICESLYQVISQEATRLGIFTYEVRYYSKASKIFLSKKYDFNDEEVLWKELLIFLINDKKETGMHGFLKKTKPLPFDPGLINDYLQSFSREEMKQQVLGELEALYEELDNADVKERHEQMAVIGSSSIWFHDEIEEEEGEEDF